MMPARPTPYACTERTTTAAVQRGTGVVVHRAGCTALTSARNVTHLTTRDAEFILHRDAQPCRRCLAHVVALRPAEQPQASKGCGEPGCAVIVQGGTAGRAAHLQVVHGYTDHPVDYDDPDGP